MNVTDVKPVRTATMFGHPMGLFVLFFTEMWERFSYYGMRAILLLFLIDTVRGGMGLNEADGAAIYGIYTASVYLLSLPGGWIADNLLGQRKSIWYGGIIIMLGHIILAIPSGSGLFYSGLCVVAVGTGLLKPNISTIVGELYPEGGARKDAAFSIFYMGINTGSLLGISIVGYLGQKVGWHYGFGAAAVAMALGLVTYRLFGQRYLGDYGHYVAQEPAAEGKSSTGNRSLLLFVAFHCSLNGNPAIDRCPRFNNGAGVSQSDGYNHFTHCAELFRLHFTDRWARCDGEETGGGIVYLLSGIGFVLGRQ